MKTELVQLFRAIRLLYSDHRPKLTRLDAEIRVSRDLGELADITYALKEYAKLLEALRKTVAAETRMAERMACMLWMQGESTEPIRTDFVTASPRISISAKLPTRRKHPEDFAKLMEFLKIPREHWDVDEEESVVVDIHFKGFAAMISDRAAKGLPLPPGVDPKQTMSEYFLTCRGKKEVDIDMPKD